MGNKKSLTYLISKYAILELIFTGLVIIFSYLILSMFIGIGLVYPANYAEINSSEIKNDFLEDKLSFEKIPFYYDYQFIENGRTIKNTIDKKYDKQVQDALKKGKSSTDVIIGSNIFKVFKKGNKKLILKYRISAVVTSPKVYRYIKNFELTYFLIVLLSWLFGFVILVRRSSKLLKNEIDKISYANLSIEKMNLDYKRENSNYKEISGVLNSIDSLAKNLNISLEKQWNMQEEQKEMIESITHDIRTPITLIKGNIELLKEDPENIYERLEDISNGVFRLESYIKKLKKFSYFMEGPKVEVTDQVIENWLELIASICRIHGYNINILAKERSFIKLDKDTISVALQNLVNNSIENSTEGSLISIGFFDKSESFTIIIKDQGNGFDNNILPNIKEKLISSKDYDINNIHGLGLSIVNRIVESNNGILLLKNYDDEDSKGAEVKMIFKK